MTTFETYPFCAIVGLGRFAGGGEIVSPTPPLVVIVVCGTFADEPVSNGAPPPELVMLAGNGVDVPGTLLIANAGSVPAFSIVGSTGTARVCAFLVIRHTNDNETNAYTWRAIRSSTCSAQSCWRANELVGVDAHSLETRADLSCFSAVAFNSARLR